METLKFVLGCIAFVILYSAVDILVPLIPAWVGYSILLGIVIGLFWAMIQIVRNSSK